jgi:hypothetical protein
MHNFCTLFDSHYLVRGLAMYRSLLATRCDFHLYIFAFDELCQSTLYTLDLPRITVVPLADFENEHILAVKPTRTQGEYCWTCASHTIIHVLDTYYLSAVTYLDADLYFYSDPAHLLEEFIESGGSVLLTEHRFSPELIDDIKFGRYCVQFVTFLNDHKGRTALDWWAERCLEWCHARLENGKFGDQKYLDDWLDRFEGVYVSSNIGAGVANWNVQQYMLGGTAEQPHVDGIPIVFYHFHGVKLYGNGRYDLGYNPLGSHVTNLIYRRYIEKLRDSEIEIIKIDPGFRSGRLKNRHPLVWLASYLWRKPKGIYNVYRYDLESREKVPT